ncbi:MAG: hypothetical protein RL341_1144 [Pseudomonadota bacterium]
MNLRLHNPHRAAQLLRGFDCLINTHGRDAALHRHAKFAQNFFALVFVDFHG